MNDVLLTDIPTMGATLRDQPSTEDIYNACVCAQTQVPSPFLFLNFLLCSLTLIFR